MSNKNSYASNARRRGFLSGFDSIAETTLATKGQFAASAGEMAKDLLIGAGGGAVVAALVGGRISLPLGIATSLAGYMTGSRSLTALGLGTMSFGAGKLAYEGVSGTAVSGLKDRFKALADDFKYRLFLDKVLKSRKTETQTQTTSGVGEVRYFVYPQDEQKALAAVDTSALDELERQIAASAQQYQQQRQQPQPQVNGYVAGLGDLDERIF